MLAGAVFSLSLCLGADGAGRARSPEQPPKFCGIVVGGDGEVAVGVVVVLGEEVAMDGVEVAASVVYR